MTQRYEFEQEKPRGGCEPSEFVTVPPPLTPPLNCSPWRPILQYEFSGGSGDTLTLFNAPQRLHFMNPNGVLNFAALFQDNDEFPVPIVVARQNIWTEHGERVIEGGGRAAAWDNYHQSSIWVRPPVVGAGCPECVHIHWRWGKASPDAFPDKNGGNPLVPPGSNQDVDLAVVAFHPGEEHPNDFHELMQGEFVYPGMVFWYSATGHQASDTFFRHGGFFQPVKLADLALAGDGPATVPPGQDLPVTFTVANKGPSFATEVSIDVFRSQPRRMVLVPELSPGCSTVGTAGVRIVCKLSDMAPGTSRTAAMVFRLGPGAGPNLSVVGGVSGNRHDPDGSNNQAMIRAVVPP